MAVSLVGRLWVKPVLQAGVPHAVLLFNANNGEPIYSDGQWKHLTTTDFSLRDLSFDATTQQGERNQHLQTLATSSAIVSVAHAEGWSDYRPARPADFIGRRDLQQHVIGFLNSVREQSTPTRVFAITGDTGVGKSSLVAKLRDRLQNRRHLATYSVLAVDMRAATGPGYVQRALLECLQQAAKKGFGDPVEPDSLAITDGLDPLESDSIARFLATVASRGQVLCLILDQFEELYSKPELYPVFDMAQRLLVSCAAAASSLAVGFVFRSDALVQQNHPAYYLWNRLADHRYELRVRPFSVGEISTALTAFERELGQKLRPDLRRKLAENCAGLPWLLKKLCLHVLEQIAEGKTQQALDNTMDVESLFARDLNSCSQVEMQCIKTIAKLSPADWNEVVELYGAEVVRALQDRRLIIRNGDRLNLYWDVFREYVLTRQVPSIPFTY